MSEYKYDLTKHCLVWFSMDPSIFLPEPLVKDMVDKSFNGANTLTLFYSNSLLNDQGRAHIERLKTIWDSLHRSERKIETISQFYSEIDFFVPAVPEDTSLPAFPTLVDIDSEAFEASLLDEKERKLLAIVTVELRHLFNGGSCALASDIVRVLSPCYQAGIYSDFDAPARYGMELRDRPLYTILFEKLKCMASSSKWDDDALIMRCPKDVYVPFLRGGSKNNDVIAVANGVERPKIIEQTQEAILSQYNAHPESNHAVFTSYSKLPEGWTILYEQLLEDCNHQVDEDTPFWIKLRALLIKEAYSIAEIYCSNPDACCEEDLRKVHYVFADTYKKSVMRIGLESILSFYCSFLTRPQNCSGLEFFFVDDDDCDVSQQFWLQNPCYYFQSQIYSNQPGSFSWLPTIFRIAAISGEDAPNYGDFFIESMKKEVRKGKQELMFFGNTLASEEPSQKDIVNSSRAGV